MGKVLRASVAMTVLLAGCAEPSSEPPAPVAVAALAPRPAPPPEPAPRKEAIPVPAPKPKTVLYLDVLPPDPAVEHAVRKTLAKAGHIEVRRGTRVPGDAAQLSLRHFRWNEDERPQSTRTLTYRRDQVTGHLLPVGAVYQVDQVSGIATVGFSFKVSLERGGRRLAETEVSDRVEAPWSTCRLARVVEPGGATKAARFVANQEMQALCAGKTAPAVSDGAMIKLAEAVLALPLNGK